jgi:hypothetical protein
MYVAYIHAYINAPNTYMHTHSYIFSEISKTVTKFTEVQDVRKDKYCNKIQPSPNTGTFPAAGIKIDCWKPNNVDALRYYDIWAAYK